MPGHVFVAPGTLQGLLSDDVLISTDHRAKVGRHFWPVFGWSDTEAERWQTSVGRFEPGRRIFLASGGGVPTDGPRRWLVDVGADEHTKVSWLLDGIRDALTEVGRQTSTDLHGVKKRVAMPVMGVGRGGFNGRRGEVIDGLLREARLAADQHDIDVVIVAANPADYSALQAVRMRGHQLALSRDHERKASSLARSARSGRLALFMGAGTGIAAGLPSWNDLLARVSERLGVDDPKAVADLGPLDAAEFLRRAAREEAAFSGEADGPWLGRHVADAIGEQSRYALSHVFLAALGVDQAITTNFDRLYEAAVAAIRGPAPLVVLPDAGTSDLDPDQGRRPWLLKLHGDVNDPSSIVLDRRSFVRYDAQRRPLGGVLQATLLTRHLLVVGASMTDDNVVRLIHEVAELTGTVSTGPLGTVLSLRPDAARTKLWQPEFEFVDLSLGTADMHIAARNLEIFLDRVALLAAPRSAHLLDPRYRELLGSPQEASLAERLTGLVSEIEELAGGREDGWREVSRALGAFGAPIQARTSVRTDVSLVPVPAINSKADLLALWEFALTYDGYRRHGGFEPVAELANAACQVYRQSGEVPSDLETARAALFFEQRRWRHFGTDPEAKDLEYLTALVTDIGRLSGGSVEVDEPEN